MSSTSGLLDSTKRFIANLAHRKLLGRLDNELNSHSLKPVAADIRQWSPLASANDGLDLVLSRRARVSQFRPPRSVELMARLISQRTESARILRFSDFDAIRACKSLDDRNAYSFASLREFGEHVRRRPDDSIERLNEYREELISGQLEGLDDIEHWAWCDRLVVSNSGQGHRISAIAALATEKSSIFGETFSRVVTVQHLEDSAQADLHACATPFVVVTTDEWEQQLMSLFHDLALPALSFVPRSKGQRSGFCARVICILGELELEEQGPILTRSMSAQLALRSAVVNRFEQRVTSGLVLPFGDYVSATASAYRAR